ncbi:Rho family GTPase Cdc42 [Mycena kentingensis (nom. inval.)]|nr:Rho family GTPase Cdc42 [Mycena kentingensis (nom. inval.)]
MLRTAFRNTVQLWSGTRIYNEEVYGYLPFDTAGSSDYDHLRPLAYPQTDVFLVCFSVDSVSSYDNVRLKWFPELRYYGPHVPIVLSAMKIDLRGDERVDGALARSHERPISREQGQRLSEELGAAEYGECSSLTQEGLLELWDKVIFRAALQGLAQQSLQPQTRRCLIL